jgi:hypothetical protein
LSGRRFHDVASREAAAPELIDALRRHGCDREVEALLRT